MALVLKDRVQETSTTTGTGTLTFAGAVTQFQTFSSAIGNGNTTYYAIYNAGGSLWEVGIGTVGAGTLSRDTVLSSSNAGSLVNFTGTLYVFGDYPAAKASYLDVNGNVNANAFLNTLQTIAATGGTTTLTVSSPLNYLITGSGGQTIKLPDATTLVNGTGYTFNNNQSSGAITVNNNSNTLIASIPSGGYVSVTLLSNATSAGSWDRHDQSPSNVSWSTNTLDYSGSITSATWNGNNIALNRGGTNASLTASAGSVTYSTASALALSAVGTSGQVLTSQGTGAPTWTTPTTGTVTSVTGTAPVVSSGGNTPAISMPAATTSVNGYLTSTDWTTFNNKGSGTVTSVAALTLGTTGTDLSSSVATGTTTPVITLNVPTASAANRGVLSSTDWTTFNGKQATLVSGTNIKTVSGTTLLGSGDLGLIGATYGGTGVNNGSNTITVAGNLTHAGAFTQSFTATANTAVTLPAGATASANNLLSSATAVGIVTGTPSLTTYLRGDGTWASITGGLGTVTSVGQTFTGGLISVSGSPITTSGTLALTVAGTSGGIPYFSSGTAWATSAALAANAIVLGGGAGVAPATTTTGTGVVTALGVNTGTAGAFVVNGGVLGTPSSGTVTNLTGTASININGTVGATTANTGAFTTVSATGVITSTLATGTAPFTVASTTQVANLNAATAGTATSATSATNLAGGAVGYLPYQSAAATTLFVTGNTTTTPQFLTSTGTGTVAQAPTLTSSTGTGSVVLATSPTLVTPALGTPSAIVLTNASGTASININGTVGATTANTGAFTTFSANSTVTLSGTTTNIAATSQTSGTITIGGTAGTGALTFGSSTASQTTNLANGVTATGNTNTIAVGNNGATGSTTTITIGSASGTSTTALNGKVTMAGTTSALAAVLTNAAETTTVSATAATGTIAYYPSTQSVLYYTTAASANWTVNLTFSSGTTLNTAMSTGQTLTVVFMVTQGATAYYNSAVQVDGSAVTPKWQGGSAPTAGNASSVDVYTYTIIKTGSAAFTVLASLTQFK